MPGFVNSAPYFFHRRYPDADRLYHFTERANLPSIKALGILSLRELSEQGYAAKIKYCSSVASRLFDEKAGFDRYVRLCFVPEHPMEYRARERGDMVDPVFVNVSNAVLNNPETRVSSGVPFQAGVQLHSLQEALDNLDLDVLLRWKDWRDPKILKRRQIALKYEILVPNHIAPNLILST